MSIGRILKSVFKVVASLVLVLLGIIVVMGGVLGVRSYLSGPHQICGPQIGCQQLEMESWILVTCILTLLFGFVLLSLVVVWWCRDFVKKK